MADILHRISIDADPERVRELVSTKQGVENWWSAHPIGGTDRLGGTMRIYFGGSDPAAVMNVIEDTPERVVWRCLEGPSDWKGTEISFRLDPTPDGGTTLLFNHARLARAERLHGQLQHELGRLPDQPQARCGRLRLHPLPGRRDQPLVVTRDPTITTREGVEMPNYLFAYSGGKGVSEDEAERNAQYEQWGRWFEALGTAVVDGRRRDGNRQDRRPGRLGQRRRLTPPDRLLDRLGRDPRRCGRTRKRLPRPRGRRRGRRLRSDRDVTEAGPFRACRTIMRHALPSLSLRVPHPTSGLLRFRACPTTKPSRSGSATSLQARRT